MANEDWTQLRDRFDELLDLPEAERAARLAEIAAEEPELARELERLLELDSDADARGGLGSVAVPPPSPASDVLVGREVAGFRVERAIGAGGMGSVFEAEQQQPRRRVALKTLRPGALSTDRLRRFRAEAEILGHLRHPGICQVHAAGTATVDGAELPYLALELVEGARSITAHASELPLDARIDLFREACDAVHAAHRSGIIHRDLKPGNVLVGSDGRAKVIDFGLARALDPTGFDVSLDMTREGDVLGTLSTMSPEHLSGTPHAIDVRSDVYSLGCILYELLVGQPHVDLAGLGVQAALKRLESTDPVVPDTLPSELRWILMKSLERDPSRRYDTVAGLADDLARYRSGQPVVAGEPSTIYRITRFARRNRVLLGTVGAVVLALTVGIVQANSEAVRANIERERADDKARMALGVNQFLSQLFLSMHSYAEGPEATVRDQLDRAVAMLDEIEDPTVRGLTQGLIGEGFINLDDAARAREHLEPAVAVLRERLPEDDGQRLHVEVVWADLLEREGQLLQSREESEQLLPHLIASLGETHRLTRYLRINLATCASKLGDYDAALAIYERLIALEPPENAPVIMNLTHRVGQQLASLERYEEADAAYDEALTLAREHGSPIWESVIRMDAATALGAQGEYAEAAEVFLRVVDEFEAQGALVSNKISANGNAAEMLLHLERYDEASACLERARALALGLEPEPGAKTLQIAALEAKLLVARGQNEAAERLAREWLERSSTIVGPGHPFRAMLATSAAKALEARGELAEAHDVLESVHAEFESAPDELTAALDGLRGRVVDDADR